MEKTKQNSKKRYNILVFKSSYPWLIILFLVALILRFLYFPDNINFAYDQARDSFASLEILKGNFKVIGPSTTASDKIFHGALIYYIWAPILFIGNGSPEVLAGFMRTINALGIFLVFLIGKKLFNKQVGLISGLLFAFSFEQTQYALFLGHPSPAAVTSLIFYLGLVILFFEDKAWGFILALFGLGLTIQFEDANALLIVSLVIYLVVFNKKIKLLSSKTFFLGIFAFLFAISTFILAEIKYSFRTTKAVLEILVSSDNGGFSVAHFVNASLRFIHDNLISFWFMPFLIALGFIVTIFIYLKDKELRLNVLFLLIWFLGGMLAHFRDFSFTYYYSPGATVSFLLLVSLIIYKLFKRFKIPAVILLSLILISNLMLIFNENNKGANSDIVIQPGMLVGSQKEVLDYIYKTSNREPFSVSAITVPLNINTTWSYLFEWYGQQKYNYLPIWGSESADGFYGNLKIETARSNLPKNRFLIIEPTVGIDQFYIDDFIRRENFFSKVVEEKKIGTIIVQNREQI